MILSKRFGLCRIAILPRVIVDHPDPYMSSLSDLARTILLSTAEQLPTGRLRLNFLHLKVV